MRSRIGTTARVLAVAFVILLVAACQPSAGGGSANVASAASAASSASAAPASTEPSTPTAGPASIVRPTDIPTDGTCEPGHTCLGLLGVGPHHSEVFSPGLAFTMASTGWQNLVQDGGIFSLLPIENPGDAIQFFRGPQATKPDGGPDLAVERTVDGLQGWLTADPAFTVGPVTAVSIGGLPGVRMDLQVTPGFKSHPGDCPVEACVSIFRGRDPSTKPTWGWDWGTGTGERQRLYLLRATDGVVAIFVDSFDGTTFDALTRATDTILATVQFDKS